MGSSVSASFQGAFREPSASLSLLLSLICRISPTLRRPVILDLTHPFAFSCTWTWVGLVKTESVPRCRSAAGGTASPLQAEPFCVRVSFRSFQSFYCQVFGQNFTGAMHKCPVQIIISLPFARTCMRNHDDPGQDTTCDWPLQYRRADINNGEQQAAKSGTSICHPSLWERAGRKLTKEPEHLKMAGTCFGVDIFVDLKKLTINQQTSHLKTWAENDDYTVYKEH